MRERAPVLAEDGEAHEDMITWLSSRQGRIGLRSDQPAGTRLRVLLLLRSVPWAQDNALTLTTSCDQSRLTVLPDRDLVASVEAAVGAQGEVELTLQLTDPTEPQPPGLRPVRVGIHALRLAGAGLPVVASLRPLRFGAPNMLGADWEEAAHRQRVLSEGWLPAEPSGAWMRGAAARIGFRADAPPGTELRVVLDLVAAGDCHDSRLVLTSGETSAACMLPDDGGGCTAWIECRVAGDGTVALGVAVTGAASPGRAPPRLGIRALGYSSAHSPADRLAVLENLLLPAMTAPGEAGKPAYLAQEADHWPDPIARSLTWLAVAAGDA